MKKYILKTILLFASVAFLSSCSKNDPTPITEGQAPAFTLKALSGESISLSDYKDKVVVLFFLGSGCPSCKAVAPSIESKLVQAYKNKPDVVVLGLDEWNGSERKLNSFQESTDVTFPLLYDASDVAKAYGTTYDRLVVINKKGEISFSGVQSASSDLDAVVINVNELTSTVNEEPDVIEEEMPVTEKEPVEEETIIQKGNAPYFALKSITGDSVKLTDYNNKVIVLFFFGNSCPACKSAVSLIESELVNTYKDNEDFVLLGLDQWNGSLASVEGFKLSTSASFPLLLNGGAVSTEYSTTYDRLVIIDKNGDVQYTGDRGASSNVSEVKSQVETLLSL